MKRGQFKLSDQQVLEIFSDRRVGRVVAAEYGISKSLVAGIRNGSRYGSLTAAEKDELVEKVEELVRSARALPVEEGEKVARKIVATVVADCRRRL